MTEPRAFGSRWIWVGASAVVVLLAVGVGYYAGDAAAPDAVAAANAHHDALTSSLATSRRAARAAGRRSGYQDGLKRGRSLGEQSGVAAGSSAGASAAEAKTAAAQAAAAEAATPEDLCADSIGDAGAYGVCLEESGQDPAAPLTSYCDAHPEIVAESGYCPSLNE